MYLGLDLGTSGVKALLMDNRQQVVASATAPLDVSRLHPGWSEQNPADWVQAAETAVLSLKASHSREIAAVRAIGLSGQMHGATLLGAADEVLRPCILWNDTRSHAQARLLDADPRFRKITGNIVFPGFTAPKLVWVKDNEPALFGEVRKVLLPKDYLRLFLTGEHISDMSDSAGTSWLDTGKRAWSTELLDATDLSIEQMPALVEGTQAAGTLRGSVAARWGMGGNVVVAGGAGDNAASAVGMGTVAEGRAFLSLGTSGVLFAANDAYRPDPETAVHTFCHALPATWHQMGVILSATDSLNWLAALTGRDAGELAVSLGDEAAGPGKVQFLPYLSGERTPHNDAAIRGAFSGIGHEAGPREMTQAVIEGVSFALCDSLEALRGAGTQLERVTAIGGGSRSRYWLKTLANTLGIAVDVPADGDFGAAFGAARLGLIAATGADSLSVCAPPATSETIEPDARLAGAYEDAWRNWRKLYPAIKGATQ